MGRIEQVVGFIAVALIGNVGCKRTQLEEISVSTQALVETSTFKIAVPAGGDLMQVAVGGTEAVKVHDRAKIVTPSGGFARLTSTGATRTELGVESKTGSIDSVASVLLQDRALVTGTVRSAGDVSKQSGATITGAVTEHGVLTPPVESSWTVQFPSSTQDVTVFAKQTASPTPGAYRNLIVYSAGRVNLRSGTYFFSQFDLESQGTLALDTSAGPIFIYVRNGLIYRGATTGGSAESLLLAYQGNQSVGFTSSFKGTIVAPNASLAFDSTTDGHDGAVFAKSVILEADARFTFRPFAFWDQPLSPKPVVTCVAKVGTDRFAALFGYENPLNKVVQLGLGATNSLSGVLANATAVPVTTFEIGRVPAAFWAPFATAITWTVRANSATATLTTPSCGSDAMPPGTPDPALAGKNPEGPSYNMGNRPKPPGFRVPTHVTSAQVSAALGTLPLAATTGAGGAGPPGSGAAPAAATFPFRFRITKGFVGNDGFFELPDMVAQVTINGLDAGSKDLGPCAPSGTCIIPYSFPLDEVFTVPISSAQQKVTIAVDLNDIDVFSGDDDVHNINLTVNNVDGTWTGTTDFPTNCSTNDGWGICWAIETTGPPPVNFDVSLCGSWNAHFVDEGFGESRVGKAVPGQAFKSYEASFAAMQVQIRSAFVPNPAQVHVINGNADDKGCIKVPAKFLVHNPAASTVSDGRMEFALTQFTTMATPSGATYVISDKAANGNVESVFFATPGTGLPEVDAIIDTSSWPSIGPWRCPPTVINLVSNRHTPMSTTAAAISAILTTSDNGIVPGTYPVVVNDGCKFKGQVDSCAHQQYGLLVGPAHTPMGSQPCNDSSTCPSIQECMLGDEGCDGRANCSCRWPHQARWKYIVAHEAGHQVQ